MWDKKGLQGLYALWGTLPTQAKHLEGQHDQSDHAGDGGSGGGSTATKPPAVKPTKAPAAKTPKIKTGSTIGRVNIGKPTSYGAFSEISVGDTDLSREGHVPDAHVKISAHRPQGADKKRTNPKATDAVWIVENDFYEGGMGKKNNDILGNRMTQADAISLAHDVVKKRIEGKK